MRTEGEGPSPVERWEQRYPANAQAVHGECTVELEKWEQTLRGCPWRTTKGVAPCAVKVARTVLNGGDEETYRKATRLVPTQRNLDPDIPCLRCQPTSLKPGWTSLEVRPTAC